MPPRRKPDRIVVETEEGSFDRFSSLTIVNDILGESSATLEVGDDGAWPSLERIIAPGRNYRVLLNGHLRMVGRAEVNEAPVDAANGATIQLVVRPKTTDARYTSAPEGVKVKGVSVKDFIVACFEPLGMAEEDFVIAQDLADVELMTGVSPKGHQPPPDFQAMTVDQAKVQPPETIWDAVSRHLKRWHVAMWDHPDGRVIVGVPNDQQPPMARLLMKRGAGSSANNLISLRRVRDWTDVTAAVEVSGATIGKEAARKRVSARAVDEEVTAVAEETGHFNRVVKIAANDAKIQAHAEAIAQRELAIRQLRKNAFEAAVDGWTYWDGSRQIPWAINTVVDVDADIFGATVRGRYLITQAALSLSSGLSATTQLTMVAPGVLVF